MLIYYFTTAARLKNCTPSFTALKIYCIDVFTLGRKHMLSCGTEVLRRVSITFAVHQSHIFSTAQRKLWWRPGNLLWKSVEAQPGGKVAWLWGFNSPPKIVIVCIYVCIACLFMPVNHFLVIFTINVTSPGILFKIALNPRMAEKWWGLLIIFMVF